jgi:virulence factor Mce-like protein
VLIGALTALITIVAVFLAYNANSGLPFVPSYDVKAELPSAANLVVGNDVRVGGTRVGAVSKIDVERKKDDSTVAVIEMKLEKALEPLPKDSTLIVRPRSALGLKYVDITPGRSKDGYQTGATIPVAQQRPGAVEIDDVFNMFDEPTRSGSRQSLRGFGDALASRGQDLNSVLQELKPLLTHLEPVMRNLADPRTRLNRFFASIGNAAAEVAPVAKEQAELFVNLDTTFTALAGIARPFLQDTISKQPPTLDVAIRDFPQQRPFLQHSAALSRELAPGVHVLPTTLPDVADALEIGSHTLRQVPSLNRRVASLLQTLADFAEDPVVPRGVRELRDTVRILKPTIAFLTPAQTTCNYLTLWFRNVSSVLSEGDAGGTWQRFIIVATPSGPNDEGHASSAPANGPNTDNHLHSNSYPNTAAPGQEKECEAANEPFYVGKTTIGNTPGNQGTKTDGQSVGAASRSAR